MTNSYNPQPILLPKQSLHLLIINQQFELNSKIIVWLQLAPVKYSHPKLYQPQLFSSATNSCIQHCSVCPNPYY